MARKKLDLDKVDLEQRNRKPVFLDGPCSACEKQARLLPRPASMKHSKNQDGLLPRTIYEYVAGVKDWTPQRDDDPDQLAFHKYLHEASHGDEDAALTALRAVLMERPEGLWHPYVRSQFSRLMYLGHYPDLPRVVRDRANEALVGLVHAWVIGLGYWATIKRSPSRPGQAPQLFPLIYEQEGLGRTAEATRHAFAAQDFLSLSHDLMERLRALPWKATRNDYRAVCSSEGRRAIVTEFVEKVKPILQNFWVSYQGPGRSFSDYCGLAGDFPSDEIIHEIAQKALAVPSGRNPSQKISYEFLGRFKFNIGGWEMLEEWAPMSASASLIKSTLRTLGKNTLTARSKHQRRRK